MRKMAQEYIAGTLMFEELKPELKKRMEAAGARRIPPGRPKRAAKPEVKGEDEEGEEEEQAAASSVAPAVLKRPAQATLAFAQ